MAESDEGTVVTVTTKGQATIPKEIREKLDIDAPGRVRFVETEDGEVVIKPVKRPAELRGALAKESEDGEQSATEMLREERARDKRDLDELLPEEDESR